MRKNNLKFGLFVTAFKVSLGFISYPLYLHYLSSFDLSVYFLFASTGFIIELLDFNFSVSLSRYFAYSYNFNVLGVNSHTEIKIYNPSVLLQFAKLYYRIVCLFVVVILVVGFSFYLYYFTQLHNQNFWYYECIWLCYSGNVVLGMYFNYMSPLLIGFGYVDKVNKVSFISRISGFIFQLIFILCGFGLITMAISTFVSALVERFLFYGMVNKLVVNFRFDKLSHDKLINVFKDIWKTSYKLGLITFSWLMISRLNSFVIGVSVNDLLLLNQYLFTFQVISILMTLAHVPINNNFGDMASYYVTDKNQAMIIFLKSNKYSIWLMFIFCICMVLFGNLLLSIFGLKHSLLPFQYIIILIIIYIFEKQLVNHTTMISLRNEVPMLKSYLITGFFISLSIILLSIYKVHNLLAYLLPQLIFQGVFNYWYWVKYNLNKFNINIVSYFKGLGTV